MIYRAVATAFRTGSYNGYGSGEYGDLGAAMAAIMLDREARSETLDADATHGLLREPIIKILHLMRSMEYTSPANRPIYLNDLINYLGQEVQFTSKQAAVTCDV